MAVDLSRTVVRDRAVVLRGDNAGVIVTGKVEGDVIVATSGEEYSLARLHLPFREEADIWPDNPAALLTWQSRIPEALVGRDEIMDQLLAWARAGPRLGIRLIHGPGGVGKTRLAFEFAARLAEEEGWRCGQVERADDLRACPLGQQGTLLVIDYAEEQEAAVRDFFDAIAGRQLPEGVRLRIVLLGRSEKTARLYEHARAYVSAPLLLEPPPREEQAWALFEGAWRKIRRLRQQAEQPPPLSRDTFDAWLALDERHCLPLFEVAFALHLAENPADTARSGAAIIRELVGREKGRVEREAEARGIDAKALRLLWALAVLHGKLDKGAIDYLRARACDDLDIPSVRDLEDISLWCDHGLNALQPDLLAAQLLEEVLRADHLSPGHWLYHGLNAAGEERRADALSRLGRLRFDYRDTLRDGQPDSTPDPLIETLAQYVTDDPGRCHALAPAVNINTLEKPLLPLAIDICRTLFDYAKSNREKAKWLNSLCVFCADSGDWDGSLKAIRRAVEIYEGLAKEDFATYGQSLAASLNNLSNILSDTGDRGRALKAIWRAVKLDERCVRGNSAANRSNLASSLISLSNRLGESGNQVDGLKAIRKAVEIYDQLAEEDFDAYGSNLATSLNNLSVDLAASGDQAEALKSIQQAVKIREVLAEKNPAAYGTHLASSLYNLSLSLANCGDHEGALAAIRRAVKIIEPFATPGTTYAEWFETMKRDLAAREAEAADR